MSEKKPLSKSTVPGVTLVKKVQNSTEYRLKSNDLKILYYKVPNSPTVTTTIVYHVGSKDEGPGVSGATHMLEHMLFKPTKTKGLLWKTLEEKGAQLNATTWHDRTLYYFTLPKNYLGDMLEVEADRMRNLDLIDKQFQPERANVLSEYEMYNSMPSDALETNVVNAAFQKHGYQHSTIGFRSDIEAFTVEKLQAFYDTYYWPNNATLIIAGDVDEQTMLQAVKKHFSGITKQSIHRQRTDEIEPKQEGKRSVILNRATPLRQLIMAYKAPAFGTKDWLALSVLLEYIGGSESSLLHEALVSSDLATSVHTALYPTKDPFLAFIDVKATTGASYQKIENSVETILKSLQTKKLSKTDLKHTITSLKAQEILSRDGTFNVSHNLAEFVSMGNWEYFHAYLIDLDTLTPADIQAVAKTYLQVDALTIGTIGN